jgi:hypothetical protein
LLNLTVHAELTKSLKKLSILVEEQCVRRHSCAAGCQSLIFELPTVVKTEWEEWGLENQRLVKPDDVWINYSSSSSNPVTLCGA